MLCVVCVCVCVVCVCVCVFVARQRRQQCTDEQVYSQVRERVVPGEHARVLLSSLFMENKVISRNV